MAKLEDLSVRAEVVSMDGADVLRIGPNKLSIVLADAPPPAMMGFPLGLGAGFILHFLLRLFDWMPLSASLSAGALVALTLGYLGVRWYLGGNPETRPYYVRFRDGKYKLWSDDGEQEARTGESSAIHIRFGGRSKVSGTTRLRIGEDHITAIYESDCFLDEDITTIREYFRKHKVQRIGYDWAPESDSSLNITQASTWLAAGCRNAPGSVPMILNPSFFQRQTTRTGDAIPPFR